MVRSAFAMGFVLFASSALATEPLTIEANSSDAFVFKKTALGFNCNMMRTPYQHNHPGFIQAYRDSGAHFIRFPGGTVANLFNWRTGMLQEYPGIDQALLNRLKGLNKNLENIGGLRTENFLDFVRKTSSDFSVVLNIHSLSPEDNKAWLQQMHDAGIAVKCIELGNELYLKANRQRYPTVESYIEASKQYAQAAREVFPQAKIGIVTSHIGYHLDNAVSEEEGEERLKQDDREQLEWNRKIAEESFYDACVVHLYTYVGTSAKPSVAEAYVRALSSSDAMFDKAMGYFRNLFPGREVWVTEWNLSGFSAKGREDSQHHGTHANALFIADFQMKMLLSNLADMGALHNLPNLLEPDTGTYADYKVYPDDKPLKKTLCFLPIEILGEPVGKSERLAPLKMGGVKTFKGALQYAARDCPEATGGCFFGADAAYLLVINRMANAYVLGDVKIDGQRVSGGGWQRVLTADALEAREVGEGAGQAHLTQESFADITNLKIGPYSVNLIAIPRNL